MNLYKSKTYLSDLRTTAEHIVNREELFNKKILVTGATGTIGSYVVDTLLSMNELENAGIFIFAAGRNIERLKDRFSNAPASGFLNFVTYDATKPIGFSFQVDYVIHAAGNAYPGAFNSDPVGTIVGNVNGTAELLKYTKEHGGRRFLYVSSGEVYGQGDLSLDSFKETYGGYVDPTSPRSCYPNSKRAAETLCSSFTQEYGLETVIVRPCHTYGPGITPRDNRANAEFLMNGLNHENIVMKSAGSQMRSYNYIGDCVSGLLTVLINGQSSQAYNLANPSVRVTIAQFAQAVAKCAGTEVIFENPTDLDIKNQTPIAKQVLNTEKLQSLGWKGCFSLEEGVSHTLKAMAGE